MISQRGERRLDINLSQCGIHHDDTHTSQQYDDYYAYLPSRLVLKPCIAEMLRTQVCPIQPVLLIDRVIVTTYPDRREDDGYAKAYRLCLTDGKRTIQALLGAAGRRLPFDETAKEGSFVVLQYYKLKKWKRSDGEGEIAYLHVEHLNDIGWQQRFKEKWFWDCQTQLHELTPKEAARTCPRLFEYVNPGVKNRRFETKFVFRDPHPDDEPVGYIPGLDRHEVELRIPCEGVLQERSPNRISINCQERGAKELKAADPFYTDADSVPLPLNFYEEQVLKHVRQCQQVSFEHDDLCECAVCIPPKIETQICASSQSPYLPTPSPAVPTFSCALRTLSQYALRALEVGKPLEPVDRPLMIRPLSFVDSAYTRRGCPGILVDVFAVVHSVDNKTMSDSHFKRDIQIVDPSTRRKIQLSVWVDAINFTPAVGTPALMRNVRFHPHDPHRQDGGSLLATMKDCGGKDWFVPNPVHVPGCDVDGLRDWWNLTKRNEENRIRVVMGDDLLAPSCGDDQCGAKSVGAEDQRQLIAMGLSVDEDRSYELGPQYNW